MKAIIVSLPFILVLVVCTLASGSQLDQQQSVPGGVSEDKPATPEVRQLIRKIQSEIRTHLQGVPGGPNLTGKVKPVSFRTQLVNGINYFVKIRARTRGKPVFYHLRIYKAFGENGVPRLMKVEGPKRKNDEITFF